jgi:cysteine desulfurase/selenocysteine lyase
MSSLVPLEDFPQLARRIEGRRIIYLDSAATALKPRPVIDAVVRFYEVSCANIHRGNHSLSQEASELFESARDSVARLINATARELVFNANTTEGLNQVAAGLGLQAGDNVVTTLSEHHSNLLPWMSRCEARLVPEGDDGKLNLQQLEEQIDERTKLVAVSLASNVTGAIHPVSQVIEIAHRRGVPVVVDAAQGVPHLPVDVHALRCDFLAFSGHKMLGPSGVGVLYVSEPMWERLTPLKLGGGTVDHVRRDGYSLKRVPHRFEAGTPNIEGVIGLGAAVAYLDQIGMAEVARHGERHAQLMKDRFGELGRLRLLGPAAAKDKLPIASLVPTTERLDVAKLGLILSDSFKVMARTGTHCAHPYFENAGARLGSLRFSAYVYTSDEDIEEAATALKTIIEKI